MKGVRLKVMYSDLCLEDGSLAISLDATALVRVRSESASCQTGEDDDTEEMFSEGDTFMVKLM